MYTDLILVQGILMILSSLPKYVHVIQVSLQYSQEQNLKRKMKSAVGMEEEEKE